MTTAQAFQRGRRDVTRVQQHGHVINQAAAAACDVTPEPVSLLPPPAAVCVGRLV